MKDVAPCPHCGASMIARNSAGDIVCAYCDAVITYHETPALEPRYAPSYGLLPSHNGSWRDAAFKALSILVSYKVWILTAASLWLSIDVGRL